MATPKFFQNFKDIDYAVSADKAGHLDFVKVKDFFRSLVIREDIYAKDTLYVNYTVRNGERPDQISYAEYGDEQYYWVILQVNRIIDYYNEWPLSDVELEEYIIKKYGSFSAAEQVRGYMTTEVKDADGNLLLPGGLSVSEDYVFSYYATPDSNAALTSRPIEVTYADYERDLNNKKKEIQILDRRYLSDYVREFKKYARNQKSQKSEVGIEEIANG